MNTVKSVSDRSLGNTQLGCALQQFQNICGQEVPQEEEKCGVAGHGPRVVPRNLCL